MADILIRGMEMPKSCDDCFLPLRYCPYAMEENGECPIVPIPEGHGRLGDLDELMNNIGDVPYKGSVRRVLMSAPTIIEADGGTDNG